MEVFPDFKELLELFNSHRVEDLADIEALGEKEDCR
jgi:hypothetical protein